MHIADAAGNVVRDLSGDEVKDVKAGAVNTVLWNYRIATIPLPKGETQGLAGPFGGEGQRKGTQGPWVLPGAFAATLVVNGKTVAAQPFTVLGDRDVTISDADRQRRFDVLKAGQRLEARLTAVVAAARTARQQLAQIQAALADASVAPAALRAERDSLATVADGFKRSRLVRIEGDTDADFDDLQFAEILPFKLGMTLGNIGGATVPMSATDLAQWAELEREVPAAIDDVNALLARLKPFQARLLEAGLWPKVPAPIEKP